MLYMNLLINNQITILNLDLKITQMINCKQQEIALQHYSQQMKKVKTPNNMIQARNEGTASKTGIAQLIYINSYGKTKLIKTENVWVIAFV